MKTKTFVSSLVLVMVVSVAAKSKTRTFVEVKPFPDEFHPNHYEFSVEGDGYRISDRGKGSAKSTGKRTRFFDLRLLRYDRLARMYYSSFERDLLIIGEITDGESGAGFLARLDKATLSLKWKRPIPAFNVGEGLIHEKHAYVTAIGFIGKINLDSGAYAWKHNNLYDDRTEAFNSFEVPESSGNTVIFRESPHYLRKKVAMMILDRTSGKILKKDL